MRRFGYIVACLMSALMLALPAMASPKSTPKRMRGDTHKIGHSIDFLYRVGDRIDRFLIKGIDTNYIALPEHSWRIAFTTGMVGINSDLQVQNPNILGKVEFLTRTTPSVDLGFHTAYRNIGFGYSWDALHAYSQKLNFSFGSKRYGLDFFHQKSANIRGQSVFRDYPDIEPYPIEQGHIRITNTSLNLWYALNSTRYSHRAAISQSYIQRRTAGSILLSLSYMATDISVQDTIQYHGKPTFSMLLDDVTHLRTHQMALGLGYGINYTPNRGKVLLHLDAYAQLVCYSIDQIALAVPDSIELPAEPQYDIHPEYPVHVTGNLRAAVSWEINEWVHMNLWASANNIRFSSRGDDLQHSLRMSNWNWQTCLSIGVRVGAGKDRVRKALGEDSLPAPAPLPMPQDSTKKRLPQWVTDFIYSPRE